MTDREKSKIVSFYDAAAANYGEQYKRDQLGDMEVYPANYFRLQILLDRLRDIRPKRLYEVGTGEGTPLAAVAELGIEVAGCDISPEMVKRTRARLASLGLDEELCRKADIEDRASLAPQLAIGPYDVAIAFGVLPHVRDERAFLDNMRALVGGTGKVFIEFRNKLFSLFTFNRFTKEFILDDLLAGVSDEVRQAVAGELDQRLAVDLPPKRMIAEGEAPGYDAILSKFHNPFELETRLAASGLKVNALHWYHYHPAMPMIEGRIGPAFRDEAMKLEKAEFDWRGYFLCSAGVFEADCVDIE